VLVLCNPHNPIGKVLDRDELLAISEVVERHSGRVFADEIHAPIIYAGNRHVPYASISDVAAGHTITAIAASKAWNLAGLKCAQVVLSNEADVAIWNEDGGWTAHGASTLGVIASIAAFDEGQPWLDGVIDYLDGNRRVLAAMTAELLPGARHVMSEGTYLAWLDFSGAGIDGNLADFFRDVAQVAVTDGRMCGEVGEQAIRFNFAMPRPLLEQAVEQMASALTAR
jgi:cysteine-S-conjugate beta-lyase